MLGERTALCAWLSQKAVFHCAPNLDSGAAEPARAISPLYQARGIAASTQTGMVTRPTSSQLSNTLIWNKSTKPPMAARARMDAVTLPWNLKTRQSENAVKT